MISEPVRGDPNQGMCISLEEIVKESDSKEYLQWKCSCWSTMEDFLIEWNVNFPLVLVNNITKREEVLFDVSRISFVRYNNMLYVIFLWSRRYMWIYCHDIVEFSNMSAHGVNVLIEPNMFDLEIESISDSENECTDNSDFRISLPIKTKEGEYQFVISSESLQLHTLKLNLSGEIAKIIGVSVSSNWWDIATYNEYVFDTDEQERSGKIQIKNEKGGKPYGNIRSLIDIFSSKWKNGSDTDNNNNKNVNDNFHRHLLGNDVYKKKLKLVNESDNIVIFSFPSIYSKWSVSFLCFVTTEKINSDGSISKSLMLFRHDSFGVVEYCWSINFEHIDGLKPHNLVAIPYLVDNSYKILKSISKNQVNLHLSLGKSHLFGLFFSYKSNNIIKLLQLIPSFDSREINNEVFDSLLSWLRKPTINRSIIYEVIDFKSEYNATNINIIEQVFSITSNNSENPKSLSNNEFSHNYNCIMSNNKKLYLLYITSNGHQLICDNIIDHNIQNNKIYFATYSKKLLYLLVNYQDFPLTIDLSNSSGYLSDHLNFNDNAIIIEDKEQGDNDKDNLELNRLLSNYRSKRTGRNATPKEVYSPCTSENITQIISDIDNFSKQELPIIFNYLEKLFNQILLEKNEINRTKANIDDIISNCRYVNVLIIIGGILNDLYNDQDSNQGEAVVLWGKCSIALDFDYWLQFKSDKEWVNFSEGSCFDQITSNFPNLKYNLLKSLDISSIFN
ncbi:hypothetical protein FG379_002762 [Cryptosporidium bovis]|uniref:uncharacterized protein n=1 Tax=Cryptosporidium bovis TaxID=310047 RepID=UPI00351AAD87|nr:hypothetical protein FG379_002762 [Cryptosporidium bovis]